MEPDEDNKDMHLELLFNTPAQAQPTTVMPFLTPEPIAEPHAPAPFFFNDSDVESPQRTRRGRPVVIPKHLRDYSLF